MLYDKSCSIPRYLISSILGLPTLSYQSYCTNQNSVSETRNRHLRAYRSPQSGNTTGQPRCRILGAALPNDKTDMYWSPPMHVSATATCAEATYSAYGGATKISRIPFYYKDPHKAPLNPKPQTIIKAPPPKFRKPPHGGVYQASLSRDLRELGFHLSCWITELRTKV